MSDFAIFLIIVSFISYIMLTVLDKKLSLLSRLFFSPIFGMTFGFSSATIIGYFLPTIFSTKGQMIYMLCLAVLAFLLSLIFNQALVEDMLNTLSSIRIWLANQILTKNLKSVYE